MISKTAASMELFADALGLGLGLEADPKARSRLGSRLGVRSRNPGRNPGWREPNPGYRIYLRLRYLYRRVCSRIACFYVHRFFLCSLSTPCSVSPPLVCQWQPPWPPMHCIPHLGRRRFEHAPSPFLAALNPSSPCTQPSLLLLL